MSFVKTIGWLMVMAMMIASCRDRPEEGTEEAAPKPIKPESPLQKVDEILTGGSDEEPPAGPSEPEEKETPQIPVAEPVPDKPGFVISPFNSKWVDVTGLEPGTLVADPHFEDEKKFFRVPEPVIPEETVTEDPAPVEE